MIPNTANDPTISSFTANVLRVHIQSGGQLTVSNTGVLNVTQFTSPGFTLDAATLTNSGTINLNSTAANISAMNVNSGSTVTNTGTINVTSGYGITNGSGATFNNNSCGRIILTSSNNNDFRNEGGTFTNAGLLQVYWWLHNTGTITNNGVLKYETLNNSGTLTNNRILIDDNEVPFFTIGAGNNATINGVFTDAAAMTSAGDYISNTFTPSPSLPGGLQTLYAKVTLSGGSCVLIVPFLYTNNIPLPVITSNPASKAVCAGLSTSFSITATGATSYQWELSTNGGSAWTNVPNSAPYSNVTTTTLNISDVTGLNNNRYRCVATNGGGSVESTGAILTVNTPTATPTGTITWLGAVSTDWNTACNWSPASVPGSGNKVVIPNTPNDPVVGTTVTVLQVKLQANAQLTVNSGASLAVTIGNDYGFIFESNTAFTNNGTTTAQPSSGNMYAAFYAEDATNATITNNGTISAQNFNAGFGAFQSSMTITNAANATINLSGNGSGFTTYSNVGTQQLTNNGTINYAGTDRVFNGVKGSAINNGLIQATSGLGILSIHTFSLTNAACAKFILTAGDFHTNPTTTTINNGYFYVAGELASGPFTNNGVLKYGTLLLSITNTAASAVIVNNSGPIFTYGVSGSSYTGTVNGIFTDANATVSAGNYTQATNTFTPLGTLPAGSQTLYAKITPSGGGCFYVVPFTYQNGCSQVATATQTMTWNGSVSTDWANPCNWSPNGVPSATNNVAIPNVTNDPVISSGTPAFANRINQNTSSKLTVNNGASLTSAQIDIENAELINSGTITNSTLLNLKYNTILTNTATGIINLDYGISMDEIYMGFAAPSIVNQGVINHSGSGDFIGLDNNGTLTNSGALNSALGLITVDPGCSINNLACGKIILGSGAFRCSSGGTVTNAGLIQTSGVLNNAGTFTNNAVLKYGTLTGTVTNSGNGSVIVNNTPTPIFTYGGTYNGTGSNTINGIYKELAASNLVGDFTAPNTFEPDVSLPAGSQTLYAKITPSGGACDYVVPFTYIANTNPTIMAAAAVTRQESSAGVMATIATVNDAETPAGNLTVTVTTLPASITVTDITNVAGTITATVAADCSRQLAITRWY